MVFARFPFKKMLVFQAKHNLFTCPNERVRRQIHRKQFFMALSEILREFSSKKEEKTAIIFLQNLWTVVLSVLLFTYVTTNL